MKTIGDLRIDSYLVMNYEIDSDNEFNENMRNYIYSSDNENKELNEDGIQMDDEMVDLSIDIPDIHDIRSLSIINEEEIDDDMHMKDIGLEFNANDFISDAVDKHSIQESGIGDNMDFTILHSADVPSLPVPVSITVSDELFIAAQAEVQPLSMVRRNLFSQKSGKKLRGISDLKQLKNTMKDILIQNIDDDDGGVISFQTLMNELMISKELDYTTKSRLQVSNCFMSLLHLSAQIGLDLSRNINDENECVTEEENEYAMNGKYSDLEDDIVVENDNRMHDFFIFAKKTIPEQ